MSGPDRRHLARGKELFGFGVFVNLCAVVSLNGSAVNVTSVNTWCRAFGKPTFYPPDSLFPIAWTTLHVMIAITGWRVWRLAPVDLTLPSSPCSSGGISAGSSCSSCSNGSTWRWRRSLPDSARTSMSAVG